MTLAEYVAFVKKSELLVGLRKLALDKNRKRWEEK
jgi:hypothetical protein